MPRIRIRPTQDEDVDALPDVERSAGIVFRSVPELAWIADDDVLSPETHRELLAYGASWVAVDAAGRVLGFIAGKACCGALHIYELAVRHECQGRGIGGALLAAAIARAQAGGLSGVTLTTFRELPWNEPFYRNRGFVTLGDAELDPRLRALLDDEAARGLPRRCAMRFAFPP